MPTTTGAATRRPRTLAEMQNTMIASGYRYVQMHADPNRTKRYRPWAWGGTYWWGRWYLTAREAAQAWLDYDASITPTRYPDIPARHPRPSARSKGGTTRRSPHSTEGPGYVYMIARRSRDGLRPGDPVTIGSTASSVEARLGAHQRANPRRLFVVAVLKTKQRLQTERDIRQQYDPKGLLGEWRPYDHRMLLVDFA